MNKLKLAEHHLKSEMDALASYIEPSRDWRPINMMLADLQDVEVMLADYLNDKAGGPIDHGSDYEVTNRLEHLP